MKVVSVEEMRRIDALAQERYGFDGYDLMAEAGRAIAETIEKKYQPQSLCVVCGKGNNAGDGFVAARMFYELGREVTVVCMEDASGCTGAARTAWERLKQTTAEVVDQAGLKSALEKCDLVIDALLGTGTRGAVTGNYAESIREINKCGKIIVSADVPSGLSELHPEEQPGDIIRATMTLTIGLPKTMLMTLPGADYVGRLVVLTINFPSELLESDEWKLNWAPQGELSKWLPPRPRDSNKGTFGSVGIVGATPSYAGATVLVARAALRAGCGLAAIYSLDSTNAIYKTALPEATSIILKSGSSVQLDEKAAESFATEHSKHKILAVGPGLGAAPATKLFFQRLLEQWQGPLVIDADGLNLLSGGLLHLLRGRKDCLLTPHPGEMARLTKLSVDEVQSDRVTVARQFASTHGVTVLLKGAATVVARPDGQTWLIPGAEAALAKGGTGDVLTGAIAALYAQGATIWQAAVIGASAHLGAGHACAKRFGSRGVLASDVADAIPLVLDQIQTASHG